MKSWLRNTLLGIIVIPLIAFSWSNIQSIWAAPEKVNSIEKRVSKQEDNQDKIAKLVIEQQARLEKNEEINKLQVQSMKESIALIAEIKKEKRWFP